MRSRAHMDFTGKTFCVAVVPKEKKKTGAKESGLVNVMGMGRYRVVVCQKTRFRKNNKQNCGCR